MKSQRSTRLTPSRVAAFVTALMLIAGGVISIWFYYKTLYQPLLLLGSLQIFPAVVNLLLYLPIVKKRAVVQENAVEDPAVRSVADVTLEAKAVTNEDALTEAEATAETENTEEGDSEKKQKAPLWPKVKQAAKAFCLKAVDFWSEKRSLLVSALILITILVFGIRYWRNYAQPALPGVLTYTIPVFCVVLFVAYIVFDKWCKYTAQAVSDKMNGEPETPTERAAAFDRAVLNSLRGALSVAKLGVCFLAAIVMLRLLGLVFWDVAAGVIVTLLFYYELIFLIISLSVRFIRHEMEATPELSIPMPGLGGEDLGILTYLEKNTGITMRSLWSIRLVGKLVPYTVISVVALLWCFSGVVKIESTQRGALYRLGKLQEEILEPGIHMTLPWPFDSVEIYETELINQTAIGYISNENNDNIWTENHGTEEYRLLLGDGKELVSINMRLEYVIDDLYTYLSGTAAPEALMQASAYELITSKFIRTDIATLMVTDRAAFVEEFKQELIERTKHYQTGLRVVSVVLESIHPPVEVASIYQELVNAKIKAVQTVETAKGEAVIILTEAESKRETLIADAEQIKTEEIAKANADVTEFEGDYAAYLEHIGAYRYYLKINAWKEAYSDGQFILVGDGVNQHIIIGAIGSK